MAVLLFLWRRRGMVRDSHALISARAKAKAKAPADRNSNSAGAEASAGAEEEGVDVGSISESGADDGGSDHAGSSPSAAAAAHFLRRYSPLFSMYSADAWFWQVFVLVRRTVFVAVSVTLVRSGGDRNFAFSLAHLGSLLLQLHFRPFQSNFFNGAEFASHILLIVLSMTLNAKLPPLDRGTEIFLFLLVVPPLAVYAVAAVASRYFGVRADRARIFAAKMAEQLQAEKNRSAPALFTDVRVELSQRSSCSAAAIGPAGGTGAARLGCDPLSVAADTARDAAVCVESSTQAL
jgi:hypothetical protein